jgi:competence protein ComEA
MPKFLRALFTSILLIFAPALFAEPLDINAATAEQFDEVLIGVGKVKAQAIVQDREKNGKFKSIDDLTRVKGIGPAIVEKNRSKLTVEAVVATPAGQPAAAASPPAVQSASPKPH